MTIGFVAAILALPIAQAGVELYRDGADPGPRRLPSHARPGRTCGFEIGARPAVVRPARRCGRGCNWP